MYIKIQVAPEVILSQVFLADSFQKKLLGYMFIKAPHYEAILFKGCNSIHTFFMNFPIDVIFIDDHFQVIKKVLALEPGEIIWPIKGAAYVLESRAGLLSQVQESQSYL